MKYCFAFTDASFCPETRTMGWSVFIKAGKKRFCLSGGGTAKTPHRAELFALEEAAFFIRLFIPHEEREVIVFRSDCLGALNKFSPKIFESQVRKKHINGHCQKSIVSEVNKWCHDTALFEMRQRRGDGIISNTENS